jgi:hypothetical protein
MNLAGRLSRCERQFLPTGDERPLTDQEAQELLALIDEHLDLLLERERSLGGTRGLRDLIESEHIDPGDNIGAWAKGLYLLRCEERLADAQAQAKGGTKHT